MSETITKEQLIAAMRVDTGATREVCSRIIDLFITNVHEHVVIGGRKLVLSGVGAFEAKLKPQRMGRNPKTGEPAVIKSRHRLSFTPERTYRKSINQ